MELEKILPKDGPPIEEVQKYVQKYKNELIVIKYGGNVFIDREIFNNFISDLKILNELRLSVIVVHGGGPRIKRELDKSNIKSKFIRGLRVTDKKIINIVENVLIDLNLLIFSFNLLKSIISLLFFLFYQILINHKLVFHLHLIHGIDNPIHLTD